MKVDNDMETMIKCRRTVLISGFTISFESVPFSFSTVSRSVDDTLIVCFDLIVVSRSDAHEPVVCWGSKAVTSSTIGIINK